LLLKKARGVGDEEVLMSKDVEIGERCWEEAKGFEAWSAIPLKLVYRPEGKLQGMPLVALQA